MLPLISVVLLLAIAAAVLAALFYVVRAAVLSALRAHHAEVTRGPRESVVAHLDADGL